MNTYLLGIIWSVSSINSDGRIVFRHKERYFLEQIQKEYDKTIYQSESLTGIQYVLKFKNNELLNLLYENGYTARNSEIRNLPVPADREFLKAYLEIHSSLDYQTTHSRNSGKGKKPRLRIYGNKYIIGGINTLIGSIFGFPLKTPQRITEKTYYLSFANRKELTEIFAEYRRDGIKFEPYWRKFEEILKGEKP